MTTNNCTLCNAKIFVAMQNNGVRVPLDREAVHDGEFYIANGRLAKHTKDVGQGVKRFKRHQCGGRRG